MVTLFCDNFHHDFESRHKVEFQNLIWMEKIKEVQTVYRLFLVSCYLLHSFWIMPSQLATWEVEWLIKLAWQYIAMTRNNLCIISISLMWCICIIFIVFQQRLRETALLHKSDLVTLSISRQKLVIKQHQYAFGI